MTQQPANPSLPDDDEPMVEGVRELARCLGRPRPDLDTLIEAGRKRIAAMTSEELEQMIREQGKNWARGEAAMNE